MNSLHFALALWLRLEASALIDVMVATFSGARAVSALLLLFVVDLGPSYLFTYCFIHWLLYLYL